MGFFFFHKTVYRCFNDTSVTSRFGVRYATRRFSSLLKLAHDSERLNILHHITLGQWRMWNMLPWQPGRSSEIEAGTQVAPTYESREKWTVVEIITRFSLMEAPLHTRHFPRQPSMRLVLRNCPSNKTRYSSDSIVNYIWSSTVAWKWLWIFPHLVDDISMSSRKNTFGWITPISAAKKETNKSTSTLSLNI